MAFNSSNGNICAIICHFDLLRAENVSFPTEVVLFFLLFALSLCHPSQFLSKRSLDKYDTEINGVNINARMSSSKIDASARVIYECEQ